MTHGDRHQLVRVLCHCKSRDRNGMPCPGYAFQLSWTDGDYLAINIGDPLVWGLYKLLTYGPDEEQEAEPYVY